MALRPTIYDDLKAKLGREPTHVELCEKVRSIIAEVNTERLVERATEGKLRFQRRR